MDFHSVDTCKVDAVGAVDAVDAVAALGPLELVRIGLPESRPAQIALIFFAVFCPTKIQSGSMFFVWSGW